MLVANPRVKAMKKEEAWLACKPKTCCYTALVIPSGRDVWRIARALHAPPWSFMRYFPTATPRLDAFWLDQSGQSFRLALAKQPVRRPVASAPCVFLLRTRDRYHRCGLGPIRPRVCQAFPSELADGVLCVRNDAGCTCRVWALTDVDLAEETALVTARQAEAIEYHGVVTRWNNRVRDAADGESVDFFAYCDFLLDSYDALAAQGAPT